MKVLHVFKDYLPESRGGIESSIFSIASETGKLGVENVVLSLTDVRAPRAVMVGNHLAYKSRTHFKIASCKFSLSLPFRFFALARRCDLIHYHFPWPYMDVLHLLLAFRKPMIVTYHSDIVRQEKLLFIYSPLMKLFFNRAKRLIATSRIYARNSKYLSEFKGKLTVIPLGIGEEYYPKSSKTEKEKLREEIGHDFFLFVGVLRYYKGLPVLLDAVRGTDLKIVIVGSGPMEEELLSKARNEGITNVKFFGAVSEQTKVALYELCIGLVFPSYLRSEAFGVSLIEASMFSKPLISCEIGTGTSYVNISGETGIVVEPGSAKELREALYALWNSPEMAKRMGEAARKRYSELFTASKAAKSYMSVYKEVLAADAKPKV